MTKINIQEATKKALEIGGMIYRKDEVSLNHDVIIRLKPTNSHGGFLLYSHRGFKGCRWNPRISDILSTEWEVVV